MSTSAQRECSCPNCGATIDLEEPETMLDELAADAESDTERRAIRAFQDWGQTHLSERWFS